MKNKLFVLLSYLAITNFIYAQDVKTIAVYVSGDDSISQTIKQIVGSQFVIGIVNTKGYSAIERTSDFLKELRREHNYQRSGFVDDEQIKIIGKEMGVDLVCAINLTHSDDILHIEAHLLEVETAKIIAGNNALTKLNDIDNIVFNSKKMAEQLIRSINKSAEYSVKEYSTILKSSTNQCFITSIDNTGDNTIVNMKFFSAREVSIRIDPRIVIKDRLTRTEYKLNGAIGVVAQQSRKVSNEIIEFALIFDKMPDTVNNIDIIAKHGWEWEGIVLRPTQKPNYFVFVDETQQLFEKEVEQYKKEVERYEKEKEQNRQLAAKRDSINSLSQIYTITVLNKRSSPYQIQLGDLYLGVVSGYSTKKFNVPLEKYGQLIAKQASGYIFSPNVFYFSIGKQYYNLNIDITLESSNPFR